MIQQETTEFNIQYLKPVVMDLISNEKRSLAFEILDLYFKKAQTIEDFDVLGYLSMKSEHRQLYLKCAEAAYFKAENSQQLYIARTNLFKAYNAMNMPEKALFYIDMNLQINPDDFECHVQRLANISLMGERETADKILDGLIQKYPEKIDAMKSVMSTRMLREGKTAQGILSFLGVTEKTSKFTTVLRMKKWTGAVQPGKKIYVEGEGGIGDEIINIRFFKNLRDYGMEPILYSSWSKFREDTVSLFRRNGFEVITETFSIDRSQLWTPMMSLPGFLNLTEPQLWSGPYLTPIKNPKNDLGKKNKFRIGIKCSGNPYFSQEEYRKIPLEKMLEYLPSEAEIYYIDKEHINNSRVTDLSPRIETWEDTIDFIDQMDCIVSSCTSLVHAAGAIGKTTFVIVPIAEYYIWSTSIKTTQSPWYEKNFQVHRQKRLRNWDEPLDNVRQQLYNMIGKK
jgi:tetratricopeptide (TPR) repeat protein